MINQNKRIWIQMATFIRDPVGSRIRNKTVYILYCNLVDEIWQKLIFPRQQAKQL